MNKVTDGLEKGAVVFILLKSIWKCVWLFVYAMIRVYPVAPFTNMFDFNPSMYK